MGKRASARTSVVRRWHRVAAVGFAGKVLGPLGLAVLILRGTWPPATLILIVTNDIIWWVPFAAYLRAAWPAYRATWT